MTQKPQKTWSQIGGGMFMTSYYVTPGSDQHVELYVGGKRGDWDLIAKQYTLGTVAPTLTVSRSGLRTKHEAMVMGETIAREIVL